jgi:two-component system chemotaxis sensor kinase CheA
VATGKRNDRKAAQEFLSEAEEILERMRRDHAELEETWAEGSEPDPELVNRLFRSAHSLKGAAGMFGFETLGALAHHLEDVLDALRLGRLAGDSPAARLVGEAVALLGLLLEGLGESGSAGPADAATADLTRRIAEALASSGPAGEPLASLDLDPALAAALTEYEEHRLRENVRQGRHILVVEASFEILDFERGLTELTASAREHGELISTLPSPAGGADSEIRFALLVASGLEPEAFAARLGSASASVRCVLPRRTRSQAASGVSPRRPASPAREGQAPVESLRSLSGMVRVDIRKLDELMNLVGDLALQRAALGEMVERLLADPRTVAAGAELAKQRKLLERKIHALQTAVLNARMVPLRQVFEKLARVARQLRRELGRNVRLDLRGAETELDKLVAEELVDPLMHLVRNAFDHAIEPEPERLAAGKPAEGVIEIEARPRGNHVVISVRDDGRGIDPDRVRRRAEAAGLLWPGQTPTERELLELLFLPGFTTREDVSETSGRGVGMDVVKSNVTALGGVVELDSVPGRGTRATLTLPVTLAILQALVVRAGDQRYAIPLNSVLETHPVARAEIQRCDGRELWNLRGEALPLVRLAREFRLAAAPEPEKSHVVVLGVAEARVGLVVDALEGQQDAVIKPIQGPARGTRGIVGATDLGGRGAVLVLDAASLVEDGLRRRSAS